MCQARLGLLGWAGLGWAGWAGLGWAGGCCTIILLSLAAASTGRPCTAWPGGATLGLLHLHTDHLWWSGHPVPHDNPFMDDIRDCPRYQGCYSIPRVDPPVQHSWACSRQPCSSQHRPGRCRGDGDGNGGLTYAHMMVCTMVA